MTKEQVLEAIRALPDDATLEDVFERLFVLLKIEKGIQAADVGDTFSQADVRSRLSRWLK